MTEKLFVYGTLQQPEVQMRFIGRAVPSTSDSLLGFRKLSVGIHDKTYPIIEKDPNSGERIDGLVLDIEQADLPHLDICETTAYRRDKVTLESGLSAWVYQK